MAVGLSHYNPQAIFTKLKKPDFRLQSSQCYMPKIVATAQTKSYWAAIEADIESYLKKAIPIRSPESVFEPMHYLTFAAPTTTASALCVAACELVGGDRSHAIAAASAIHLMHAAAYAHENLPLTDMSRLGPSPIIQHKFDPNIELLTGDGIISFGFELLASSMDLTGSNPDKILRVTVEITRAAGSQGMIDGQYRESVIDGMSGDTEATEYVCKKKEGELHACGAACGAILGGGAEEEVDSLRNFGLYAGMVQGMLVKNRPGIEEKIRTLRLLALKELERLPGKNVELILSLVEPRLSRVPS